MSRLEISCTYFPLKKGRMYKRISFLIRCADDFLRLLSYQSEYSSNTLQKSGLSELSIDALSIISASAVRASALLLNPRLMMRLRSPFFNVTYTLTYQVPLFSSLYIAIF